MALFRKKTARVVRRGAVEEPQQKTSGQKSSKSKNRNKQRSSQQRDRNGKRNSNRTAASKRGAARTEEKRRSRPHLEVVPPPNTARKQMLVRSSPHQTQIVVLEGPILVEHYVARSDQKSLVGNVYVGKVRNVLPGMEAAFVDFGEGKNGVLYAGDVNYDDAEIEGKARRASSGLFDPESNRDAYHIGPGETVTLTTLQGPGEIRHMWFTIAGREDIRNLEPKRLVAMKIVERAADR